MGLFTPKYPKSETANATGQGDRRETRRERAAREGREAGEAYCASINERIKEHQEAMEERDKRRAARWF